METAIVEVTRALELAPDDVPNLCLRAALCTSRAKYDLAETDLKRAAKLAGFDPDVQVQLGVLFCKRARWREAIEPLRAAISADPKHAAAHYHLGDAYNASTISPRRSAPTSGGTARADQRAAADADRGGARSAGPAERGCRRLPTGARRTRAVIEVRVEDLAFYAGEAIVRPATATLDATTPLLRRLEVAAGQRCATSSSSPNRSPSARRS